MARFGYARPNVEFRQGFIEDLRAAGVEDASVDVVISNCVLNLSPDKPAAFSEIFRVLKPGDELLFADVFRGPPRSGEVPHGPPPCTASDGPAAVDLTDRVWTATGPCCEGP